MCYCVSCKYGSLCHGVSGVYRGLYFTRAIGFIFHIFPFFVLSWQRSCRLRKLETEELTSLCGCLVYSSIFFSVVYAHYHSTSDYEVL